MNSTPAPLAMGIMGELSLEALIVGRHVFEVLRQLLEERSINVSRANYAVISP